MTRWVRAGLVAAVFSGLPSTAHGLLRGHDLLGSTEAIGSVVLPPASSRPARIAVGAVVHLVLSLFWARVIVRLLGGRLRAEGPAEARILAGTACGLGIAALDLGVVGRRLPPIRALPPAPQVADHIAFGALVAWALKGRS